MDKSSKLYNDYSSWIRDTFGERVQKISINAGFTCPNRDGSKGTGGCTYCDNSSFNPAYCSPNKRITEQLEEGISFFNKKYPAQKYFAYFQAYSNTYENISVIKNLFEEALSYPGIIGLSVATRPDCLPDEIIYYLSELNKKTHLTVEIGAESTLNKTLVRINRGHSWEDSITAINKLADSQINTTVHLILGLPGESIDDILNHAIEISKFPIKFLKLHQMQILKNTAILDDFVNNSNDFLSFTVDEYLSLCISFLELLSPDIIIERFTSESRLNSVIAPNWGGVKNFEITEKVVKKMKELNTWQGRYN
ncbi:MAG: TIGR01212 family radical SAM protein [Bacteroidota bacterium]